MAWWSYALIAALAASATAVLAKVGIEGVPSNLATAIRTVVVLFFAWAMVLVANEHQALRQVSRRSAVFLVLSGVGTPDGSGLSVHRLSGSLCTERTGVVAGGDWNSADGRWRLAHNVEVTGKEA